MASWVNYIGTAVTDSIAAAATEYAANTETFSEATDIGIREARDTETPIFVLENDTPTAFTMKGPRSSIVVLTEELVDGLEDDEAEAVLQHELAHADKQDTRGLFILGLVATLLPFVAAKYTAKRSGKTKALLAFIALQVGGALLMRWVSRQRELEADRLAAEAMDDPEPLARALHRLAEQAEQPTEYPPIKGLFATHPAIDTRVAALTDEEPENS